ncbi:DUF3822 family protein [Bacteroides reticulotermitis]|mgnify:CR=1 FL=1|uniref:DUF3822 domain-containing protein n=2 Tax=Bacteroides reticulotermitis TaxID=1133319 RepID=W4V176_9BACE|nr:DUF3822 family protein [Bacteroides reticulotermitis]MBB4045909.1 hypothetical protein [Bacteroides reticulotermitis]GAE86489.1 hypothetical protein JCM10512_5002 [Bacteroides reticulotermitis JCM 10512]HJD76918.1 DUF3822 family protein [Bacteroides reticulotermitis]
MGITVNFTKSEQYTLSFRLGTDGFSFSIYNPIQEDSLTVIEREVDSSLSLTANLKSAFRELEFLSYSYKRINIMITGKRFTTIPLELFEDEQAEVIFHHNHPKRENEIILYNVLKKNSVVVIFGIDKSAYSFLLEQYPDARFYSQSSPLIDFFSTKSRLGNSRKMYASLRPDAIDLYGFERGHLLLVNSFECAHIQDRIYYLLYTWKQLGFDQERDELHLTGVLADKEILIQELKKYILQVFITNPATNIDMQALLTCE